MAHELKYKEIQLKESSENNLKVSDKFLKVLIKIIITFFISIYQKVFNDTTSYLLSFIVIKIN